MQGDGSVSLAEFESLANVMSEIVTLKDELGIERGQTLRATKAVTVREGAQKDSPKMKALGSGSEFRVDDLCRTSTGTVRVKLESGWAKQTIAIVKHTTLKQDKAVLLLIVEGALPRVCNNPSVRSCACP